MARTTIEERGREIGMLTTGVPLRRVSIISIDIPEIETFYDILSYFRKSQVLPFCFQVARVFITVRAFDFFGFENESLKVAD